MILNFKPVQPALAAETILCTDLLRECDFPNAPLPLPFQEHSDLEVAEPTEKKIRRIQFINDSCINRGTEAERVFSQLACDMGWTLHTIKQADLYDYRHHVDCMFRLNDNELWVDVKSQRALRRNDKLQNEYMFVELMQDGWLFGGKATIIAQQILNGVFLLFDRIALADYVNNVVLIDLPVVPWPEQSLHRVYIRESKTSCALSLIRTRDAYEVAGCGMIKTPEEPTK